MIGIGRPRIARRRGPAAAADDHAAAFAAALARKGGRAEVARKLDGLRVGPIGEIVLVAELGQVEAGHDGKRPASLLCLPWRVIGSVHYWMVDTVGA